MALGEGAKAIGLLADTHSTKSDGSDLPESVIAAFRRAEVDLIVHLGDIGKKAILERLAAVAPVLVPFGANKGYLVHGSTDAPVKVLATGRADVGLWFNLAQPDKKITVADGGIDFGDEPFEKLMARRFRQPVDVVAFGGTHRPMTVEHGGVLFVNPGSPTLPVPGSPAAVGVVRVDGKSPSARIVEV